MAANSFKEPGEFFKNLSRGAVATRAVMADLRALAHDIAPLERGSDSTTVWTGVKRKALRVPDLVCLHCGQRFESKGKSKPQVSMSHGTRDERVWDYGLEDDDIIAYPVAKEIVTRTNIGTLDQSGKAAWTEHVVREWDQYPVIPYVKVSGLRQRLDAATGSQRKDPTRGAEVYITWPMWAIERDGEVMEIAKAEDKKTSVEYHRVTVKYTDDTTKRISLKTTKNKVVVTGECFVTVGQSLRRGEFVGGVVEPLKRDELRCQQSGADAAIERWLATGTPVNQYSAIKLARLTQDRRYETSIRQLFGDPDVDFYVRLEASAYLIDVLNEEVPGSFQWALNGGGREKAGDAAQVRLEAILTLSECGNGKRGDDVVEVLQSVLVEELAALNGNGPPAWAADKDSREEHHETLAKAAVWALGHIGVTSRIDTTETLISVEVGLHREVRSARIEALVDLCRADAAKERHLVSALFRAEPNVRSTACAALLRSRLSDDAAQVLREATKNGEVTLEAIQVLALSTEFEERSLADTVSAEHLEAITALRALAANESLGLGIR